MWNVSRVATRNKYHSIYLYVCRVGLYWRHKEGQQPEGRETGMDAQDHYENEDRIGDGPMSPSTIRRHNRGLVEGRPGASATRPAAEGTRRGSSIPGRVRMTAFVMDAYNGDAGAAVWDIAEMFELAVAWMGREQFERELGHELSDQAWAQVRPHLAWFGSWVHKRLELRAYALEVMRDAGVAVPKDHRDEGFADDPAF